MGLANWPRFHFDNANTAFNPFETALSPTNVSGLVQKWAISTAPGSSPDPIEARGLVYVAPADGVVRALDPATGATVWATDTGGPMSDGFAPTFAGGRLYVTNDNGDVLALDARSGSIVWDVHPNLGASGDPAVANGLVYVEDILTASTAAGIALDAATGQTVLTMQFPLANAPAVAFGMVFTEYVYGGQLVAMNAATGVTLWDFSEGGEVASVGSPVVGYGSVFAGIDEFLFSVNDQTGKKNWQWNKFSDITPAIANGVLYFATSAFLYAFDAKARALVWKEPIPGIAGSWVAVANHAVYVGAGDGTMRAYDASTGTLLWESPPASAAFDGPPIVVNGMVFASTADGTVYAFGLP